MTLGKTIKRLRKQRGMKASVLAKEFNGSKSYISQIEHDKRKPSQEQLQKIADTLGYPLCAFDDTEYDDLVAMHRLFSIYRKYEGVLETDESIRHKISDGTLEEGVYISFKKLQDYMDAWFEIYKKMKDGTISEAEFQEWMDAFTVKTEPNMEVKDEKTSFDEKMNKIDGNADKDDTEE